MNTVDQFLHDHKYGPDGSLYGPSTLQEVRERLAFITSGVCECDESPHENAIHDLAFDDVPVLLTLIDHLSESVSGQG